MPRGGAGLAGLPARVRPWRVGMRPGRARGDSAPALGTASSSYRYPALSPQVNNPAAEGWPAVPASEKDGQLVFTTAALPQDLSFYGEGSADLWLSATAANTDIQVTVSEVRPDGQEMFVQRRSEEH